MDVEYKTLRELDVKPGDVVESMAGSQNTIKTMTTDTVIDTYDIEWSNRNPIWRIVSRASDTPKLWRDMTPEEKGALLLAHHEGKLIERFCVGEWSVVSSLKWFPEQAYRVHRIPKRETVTLHGSVTDEVWGRGTTEYDTHRITFDLIDGRPDCDSIKMEPL